MVCSMRTFFALDKDKFKVAILTPTNVQWNRKLCSPGSFSIEIAASQYNKDWVYIYRDGGEELGVIQKYDYHYSSGSGKVVSLSGSFYESLLYNMPVTAFNYLRQLDNFAGEIFYDTTAGGPPTGYDKKVKETNLYTIFTKGKSKADAILMACRCVAQLSEHEYNKYISHYNLNNIVKAFDEIDHPQIKDEAIARMDARDENNDFDKPADSETSSSTGNSTSIDLNTKRVDEQGRMYFEIKKGDTVYLGDVLYNWLNGYWIKDIVIDDPNSTIDVSRIPPYVPSLKCIFDPYTRKVTLTFSDRSKLTPYVFSAENNNISDYSISQDISNCPSTGIARAVYLKDSTNLQQGENQYGLVEGIAKSDKYSNINNLPLNPLTFGKLVVETDYLGNVFEDLIGEYDCEAYCNKALMNFNKKENTETRTLTPIILATDEYRKYYDLGKFVEVEGEYHRIIEISEVVKDGGSSITLTLDASKSNLFKEYYTMTHNEFDGF